MMVVKIMESAPSVGNALGYNSNKVAAGKATVLVMHNIDNKEKPMETFARYEKANIRTENVSLHLSINPGPRDTITPEQVKDFAKEYMDRMGYGEQPYILYQHNDIDRQHYHIVSINVREDGRSIDNKNNFKRSKEILKALGPKYGFVLGNGREKKKEQAWRPGRSFLREYEPRTAQHFDVKAGNLYRQVENIVCAAMEYKFKTPMQFQLLLNDYGLQVSSVRQKDGSVRLFFQGIDPKTDRPTSKMIDGNKLTIPTWSDIRMHMLPGDYRTFRHESERISNVFNSCIDKARSEAHLSNMMAKTGISATFIHDDRGGIKDIIFVDHTTRCCMDMEEARYINNYKLQDAELRWDERGAHEEEHTMDRHHTSEILQEAIESILAIGFGESSRRNEDELLMKRGMER